MNIHEEIQQWEHPVLPDNLRFKITPCSMMHSFYVKLQVRKKFFVWTWWETWDSRIPFDSSEKMSIPECVVYQMFKLKESYDARQEWRRLAS